MIETRPDRNKPAATSLAIAAVTAVVLPGIPGAFINGGVDVSVPKAGASRHVP